MQLSIDFLKSFYWSCDHGRGMLMSYLRGSLAYKSWKLTKIMPNSLQLLNHYILSNAPQKICQWALKNAMRVYVAELICSTRFSGFQIFKLVFCIHNKLRLEPWDHTQPRIVVKASQVMVFVDFRLVKVVAA